MVSKQKNGNLVSSSEGKQFNEEKVSKKIDNLLRCKVKRSLIDVNEDAQGKTLDKQLKTKMTAISRMGKRGPGALTIHVLTLSH